MAAGGPVSQSGGSQDRDAQLDALLEEGEQLCADKRYDEAISRLRAAIEQYPDSPLPHHALSVVCLMRLREDYEHLEVWEDLADGEAHFEAAVKEAEAALDLDEKFVPARNNLGTLFALRGWWEDAIRQWEMSLTLEPGQSQVREEMSDARRHLGE